MAMTLDPAVADLLAAVGEALDDLADWRASAVWSATTMALEGGDPGAAADWLRDFLATRAQGGGSR